MRTTTIHPVALFTSLLVAACGTGSTPSLVDMNAEDSFISLTTDELTSLQRQELLNFVNTASLETLDDTVGLDSRAANNIVAFRAGGDGVEGTADDQAFATLEELDAIPYVGEIAMLKLIEHVFGWLPNDPTCDETQTVHGITEGSPLALDVLDLANGASLTDLDDDISLDSRAANNIVADRPFACLSELDAVSYVGASAFDALAAYLTAPPTGEALLISEVLYNAEGLDRDVFVELHGPAGAGLDGYALVGVNGSNGSDYNVIRLVGTVGDDGFFVVGHPDAAPSIAAVADQSDARVDYQNGPDSLQLRRGDLVVDAVAYGHFAGLPSAGEGTPATDAWPGSSLARLNFDDANDNTIDFVVDTTPTPGAPIDAEVVNEPDPEPDPEPNAGQTATSPEQCFASSLVSYLFHYIDLEPPFATDGQLTVRHRGFNPYGPRPYTIYLETEPDTWTEVATTFATQTTVQEQSFTIPATLLEAAYAATGWLRFRNENVYTGPAGNCVELSMTVGCESCFECPAGTVDLGIGCQPVDEPYSFAPLGLGMNCDDDRIYSFLGVPEPTGAGTLEFGWAVCDGGTATVRILVDGSWEPLTTVTTSLSCGFANTTVHVPRSLLSRSIDADATSQMRFEFDDRCVAGMGCGNLNDPCMRGLLLTAPR